MSNEHKTNEVEKPCNDKANACTKESSLACDLSAINNLTNAIYEQINHQKVADQNVGSTGDRQIDAQERGNRIAKAGLFISGSAALLTIAALAISIHSTNLAREGVAIADRSFNQAKSQWEKDNHPDLQVGNVSISPLVVGNPISISYVINNYGKQSAKIISATGAIVFSTLSDMNDFKYLTTVPTEVNIALRGGSNFPVSLVANTPLPQHREDSIMRGLLFIYLMGKVSYRNSINDSLITYSYNYRISLYPHINFTFITDSQIPGEK